MENPGGQWSGPGFKRKVDRAAKGLAQEGRKGGPWYGGLKGLEPGILYFVPRIGFRKAFQLGPNAVILQKFPLGTHIRGKAKGGDFPGGIGPEEYSNPKGRI